MRYAMVIDTLKCVGCSDCVVACQTENNVPHGYCRDWIVEVVDGSYPNVEIELRSERCNHCDNSPCVRCCPTGASHIIEGGIVVVTDDKCIGCGACIQSCHTTLGLHILKATLTNVLSVFTRFEKGNNPPAYQCALPIVYTSETSMMRIVKFPKKYGNENTKDSKQKLEQTHNCIS